MERLKDEGVVKWAALGACIIALEYVGSESLTHACHRGRESKLGKALIPLAIGVTAAHLMDKIPHQYDPYYVLAGNLSQGKNKVGDGEDTNI